jgi:hypothetical protein
MIDIYLLANLHAQASLPSHSAMNVLHDTLESIYNTHLPNPSITISTPSFVNTYSLHSSRIDHRFPNHTHPPTYPHPKRTSITHSPIGGVLAWNWQDFVYTYGSKKGGSSPL